MKNRWLSLFVENNIGVLAKISGLFSGKAYNIESLSVGITEDPTISRVTIGSVCDDATFEQIKKQLNRCVGIISVIDFTDADVYLKELVFIKINRCSKETLDDIYKYAAVNNIKISDIGTDSILLEIANEKEVNDRIIHKLQKRYTIEIVKSGTIAIESCKTE